MCYPKVLIVSNNSISKSSNTGRTLANLFTGWPKDRLAQFCISTTEPDYDVCDNYYLLTDRSMLDGFKHYRKGVRCDIEVNKGTEGNTIIGGKKAFRTPLKMIARQIVWGCKRWKSKEFEKWVDSFVPDIVFLWNSDCAFILDIARFISINRSIPIVMYNTEGYYFFDKNIYAADKWFGNIFYPAFHNFYKRRFKKMMERVVLSIHLNATLRNDYYDTFGGRTLVLYTGSNLKFDSSNLHLDNPIFSYLGNLGLDRHKALIDIASTLRELDGSYRLDIYGQSPNSLVEEEMKSCPGISYHGSVAYEEVVKVMYGSTILFHAETQEESFKYYLRYGFSTKIGDSISSGHPFLMYSSPDIAGAQYVIETGAAWYAKNKQELKKKIISILNDDSERNRVLEIAKETAKNNHDARNNTRIIQDELKKICTVANN